MMRYRIARTLQPLEADPTPGPSSLSQSDAPPDGPPLFEVMTLAEGKALYPRLWEDLNFLRALEHAHCSKADVLPDYGAGSVFFSRKTGTHFFYCLRPNHLLILEDTGLFQKLEERLCAMPLRLENSPPCFFFELLELLMREDVLLLTEYDKQLAHLEDSLLAGQVEGIVNRLHDYRKHLRKLHLTYSQCIDMADCLSDEGEALFTPEECRLFRLLSSKASRIHDQIQSLQEHTLQLQDMHQAKLDARQNKIMQILTVLTAIFLPLTLIAGWYGMNFAAMPELQVPWAYPTVILASIALVIGEIVYFMKKGWFK